MKKRLTAIILTIALILCSGFSSVSAAELKQEDMTRVVLAVKNKLMIGDEYSVFDYNYYQQTDGITWNFYWDTEDYSRYISATCDEEGRITYAYLSSSSSGGIPTYTKQELIPAAEAYIDRILPETEGHYRFRSASFAYYQNSYTYDFVRVENGIDLPDNTVTVTVGCADGELYRISCNWDYEVEIPAADIKVTDAEAAAKIGSAIDMELRYYLTYSSEGSKVFLAYTPSRSYMAVNAVTGEVYDTRTYWEDSGRTSASGMAKTDVTMADEADNGFQASLSEAELGEIDKLKDLISDETAIAIIRDNPYLQIDPSINTASANLRTSSTRYTWNITLRDSRPIDRSSDDTYRAYASATVDARTGEIISFSASNKSYYEMTEEELKQLRVNYDKDQCTAIFEAFAKDVNSEMIGSAELRTVGDTYTIAYDADTYTYTYGGYSLYYVRVNEQIPLEANYISGAVNGVTGKVFSYYTNWTQDITFPSPETAITPEAAFDSYISYDGFDLVYEIVTTVIAEDDPYDTRSYNSVRLVYRTAISPSYVDAFTGHQLSYNGTEYVKAAKEFAYTDIEGSQYERAIRLLADIGIGFETTEYQPDKEIILEEFQQLLDMSYYFSMKAEDRLEGNAPATRLRVAAGVVKALGYGELAKLPIFKTGYSDEDSIDDCNVGYAALAKGFGIMDAKSGNKFKPNDAVTRGEAADIILKMIAARSY